MSHWSNDQSESESSSESENDSKILNISPNIVEEKKKETVIEDESTRPKVGLKGPLALKKNETKIDSPIISSQEDPKKPKEVTNESPTILKTPTKPLENIETKSSSSLEQESKKKEEKKETIIQTEEKKITIDVESVSSESEEEKKEKKESKEEEDDVVSSTEKSEKKNSDSKKTNSRIEPAVKGSKTRYFVFQTENKKPDFGSKTIRKENGQEVLIPYHLKSWKDLHDSYPFPERIPIAIWNDELYVVLNYLVGLIYCNSIKSQSYLKGKIWDIPKEQKASIFLYGKTRIFVKLQFAIDTLKKIENDQTRKKEICWEKYYYPLVCTFLLKQLRIIRKNGKDCLSETVDENSNFTYSNLTGPPTKKTKKPNAIVVNSKGDIGNYLSSHKKRKHGDDDVVTINGHLKDLVPENDESEDDDFSASDSIGSQDSSSEESEIEPPKPIKKSHHHHHHHQHSKSKNHDEIPHPETPEEKHKAIFIGQLKSIELMWGLISEKLQEELIQITGKCITYAGKTGELVHSKFKELKKSSIASEKEKEPERSSKEKEKERSSKEKEKKSSSSSSSSSRKKQKTH